MYLISFLLIIISILHTAFDAISDGIKDKTHKTMHWMQSGMIAFIMLAYYLQYWWGFDPFFLAYLILIRYSMFDTIYNEVTDNDLNYTGTTNHWYAKLTKLIPDWITYCLQALTFISAFIVAHYFYIQNNS